MRAVIHQISASEFFFNRSISWYLAVTFGVLGLLLFLSGVLLGITGTLAIWLGSTDPANLQNIREWNATVMLSFLLGTVGFALGTGSLFIIKP